MTSTPVQPSARRKKAKAYWVPREHGAWSWLVSPVIAGATLSPHLHQLLLLGVALGGYLLFNAASWWAKMPPKRRVDAVPPALTYAALTAALALALLVTAGWGVLGWFGVLLVPLAVAFVLTLRRAGRSLASGLATAVASSALLLVAVQPDLPALLAHSQASTWWAFAIMYGSTAGTLFAVKSMIRESGSNAFLAASVAWHLAWVAVAAGGTAYGLPLAWTAYFLLTTVRAAALPLIARRHPLRPGTIGIVELCLTLVLLALYVWPGV
ncbi:MAG TPA: YwiC-like family protein [Propionibacteriaceae bacterium]|nr:YwiC-like family protein [Propionibacteriaceae bacterium]